MVAHDGEETGEVIIFCRKRPLTATFENPEEQAKEVL